MRFVGTTLVLVCLALLATACSTRRVGKNSPAVRADKAYVRVAGTRRVVGREGDVGYDVSVVRVDGERKNCKSLWLDPGDHEIQLRWTRSEITSWGLGYDTDTTTRWTPTANGCCTLDVNVTAGRAYTLVWDERRVGTCPMCLLEVPPCP